MTPWWLISCSICKPWSEFQPQQTNDEWAMSSNCFCVWNIKMVTVQEWITQILLSGIQFWRREYSPWVPGIKLISKCTEVAPLPLLLPTPKKTLHVSSHAQHTKINIPRLISQSLRTKLRRVIETLKTFCR